MIAPGHDPSRPLTNRFDGGMIHNWKLTEPMLQKPSRT